VLGAREREDHIYCEREGLAYRGLGFEDEPGIADSDSDARAQLSNAVRVELRCLLDDLGPEFVLAPFAVRRGARNHIHHSIVSDAAIDVMRSRKRAILGLFDEVCYSRLPLNEIPRVNGEAYIPHLVPLSERALHRKLESMRIYSTQNLSRFDRAVRAAEGEVVRLPCNGFHPQAGEPSARAGTDLEPSVATVAPRVLTGLCIEGLMGMGAAKPARAGVGS
jgi:LmbE family N-acetylglucosaminyl deacetylase